MIYIWLDAEFSGGMERKKKPYRFWSKKWVLYPKKTISLLNEGVEKRKGKEKEKGTEEQHDAW